jgi:hypothetical protein
MENVETSDQSLVGILAAIEILQEVLILNRITTADELAIRYDFRAHNYSHELPEAAAFLEILVESLRSPRLSSLEALLLRKPQGSA